MTSTNKPRMPELRRASLTASSRWFIAAGSGALATLLLLFVHVLIPAEWLQLVSLWFLGGSLLCVWIGVLTRRMPVLAHRALLLIAASWGAGTALSVWLAGWALASRPFIWRLSIRWIALGLSFAAGALLLRASLRKRTAPIIGRLISLVSPLMVLLVILLSFFGRPAP